jgi:molybdopterin/thiamine biosynthesis adenylyltransferase
MRAASSTQNGRLPSSCLTFQRGAASKARLSELNPLVRVNLIEVKSAEEALERFKMLAESKAFDLAIASDLSTQQLCQVNQICRSTSAPDNHLLVHQADPSIPRTLPFISVGTFGLFGYFFIDLGNHIYTKYVPNDYLS